MDGNLMSMRKKALAIILMAVLMLPVQGVLAYAATGEANNQETNNIVVGASEVVEFVYFDQRILAIREEGYIVFGLVDVTAIIKSASIELLRIDDQIRVEFDHSAAAGNAALFSFVFETDADAAAYRIASIRCLLEGSDEDLLIDFLNEDVPYDQYTFDVVTAQLKEQLGQANGNGDVSVFYIDENGDLKINDSIEWTFDAIYPGQTSGLNANSSNAIIDYSGITSLVASTGREEYLIVALDPGHGGSDPGTILRDPTTNAITLREADINWKIAAACANELATYTGVSTYITRTENENPSIQARVDRAIAVGADVFVSLHINASPGTGTGTGAEVWYPSNASYYSALNQTGRQLADQILVRLNALGLYNRGAKTLSDGDLKYPDGSAADYYGVIRYSRLAGVLGIIVEHAFIDHVNDGKFLADDANLVALGNADASGVASYYGLVKATTAKNIASVAVRANIAGIGWQTTVFDQKVAGTTGKSLALRALQLSLQNAVAQGGSSIEYRTFIDGSWQSWVSNGQTSGNNAQNKPIEVVQIRLTGSAAVNYDVYYRVHSANLGWLGWAKNGARAGSAGYNYQAEAIQVVVVPTGTPAPGSTNNPYMQKDASSGSGFDQTLTYQAHVANVGWQPTVGESLAAGTTGRGLAMEALIVDLVDQNYPGNITFNAHVSNIGWQGWKANGQMVGTTGRSLQIEAIQIMLTGQMSEYYDVYYRAHCADVGWLPWVKNGEIAGTTGRGLSLQALEIKLVAKGTGSGTPTASILVESQAHVANIGWQSTVYNSGTIGTTGRSLAMEALIINIPNQSYTGTITYNAHVQNIGWQGWKTTGQTAGTTGQSLQMEAIRIQLTGQLADKYDVYYRAHSANVGWLGWAKNGESAGTEGYTYRLEALQVSIVPKGSPAPGSTSNPFVSRTSIMGSSQTTVAQMVRRYNQSGNTYPANVYAQYGAPTITDFCTILLQEANAEGLRAEVVFAQAMHETGWLRFGGDVKPEQCNFAGIGATGGVPGHSFESVRIGLRAQVQHLKAYASTASLNQECVDPRFHLVTRGIAPLVEDLGGRWAVDAGYGTRLVAQMDALRQA